MRLPLVLGCFLAASGVSAAECPQAHAIYADRDAAYEIAFEPVGSEAAATSHHFKVTVAASGTVLDGIVMTGDDPPRSNGMILHDCPEGDATGAEIAACTVWEGVIYALGGTENGDTPLLPAADATAAERLLFAGFGPAVRYSRLWESGKANVAPWDILTLKGCGA